MSAVYSILQSGATFSLSTSCKQALSVRWTDLLVLIVADDKREGRGGERWEPISDTSNTELIQDVPHVTGGVLGHPDHFTTPFSLQCLQNSNPDCLYESSAVDN